MNNVVGLQGYQPMETAPSAYEMLRRLVFRLNMHPRHFRVIFVQRATLDAQSYQYMGETAIVKWVCIFFQV